MRRGRLLWAGVATAAFTIPLIWTLLSPGAPDRQSTPIQPKVPAEPLSISFSRISPWGDERIHEMSLFSPVPVDILRHTEIHITFYQSDKASRHPATGRLEVVGTPCIYEMQPGAEINNGIPQPFVRTGRCLPSDGRPTGELWLTVKMGGPGALGLFTLPLAPADRSGGMIYIGERREGIPDPPPTIMGVFVDELPGLGLRRVNLLSYLWTGSTEPWRVWSVIALIAVLVFAGIVVYPMHDATSGRGGFTRAAVAGTSSLAAALALSYAVMLPPMMAADETHHFASFGAFIGRPISKEAAGWVNTNHVERIRAHQAERFRPRDIDHESTLPPWFEIHSTRERSGLTAFAWAQVGRILPTASMPTLFAAVRSMNVLVFALTVAAAAWLFIRITNVPFPQLLCFPFLFVPTLPFFAMFFSESALLTSVYVLFSAALALLFLGGERSHWAGVPLGIAAGAMAVGARNSLPMIALVVAALLARALLASGNVRNATVFWVGLFASVVGQLLVLGPPDLSDFFGLVVDRWPSLVPWSGQPNTDFLQMLAVFVALVAAGLAGFGVEVWSARARVMAAVAAAAAGRSLARWGALAAALAIVASMVGSLWCVYPGVLSIEGASTTTMAEYVRGVITTSATMFRLTGLNPVLSNSFWVGFGWLDTIPGPPFATMPVVLSGLSLCGLLVHIAMTRDVYKFAWLIVMSAGLVSTLVIYAIGGHAAKATVHGRYLIGWYLAWLAIAWVYPALQTPRQSTAGTIALPRPAMLLGLCLFVHAYSLVFILRRYF